MRGVQDIGGLAGGPIDREEHGLTFQQKRIDALSALLRDEKRRLFTTDANRRAIEALPRDVYDRANYYERWIYAIRTLLVERGVLSEAEIAERVAAVKRRHGMETGL